MSDLDLDKITSQFAKTTVNPGVSFQGRSLVLDSESQCDEVVKAIEGCKDLQYLNLEGNTLGVDACKAISKALEKKSELKKALWKDIFTGRKKSEIPLALEHLGNGLMSAGVMLTELDMSDNAFGPIGIQGLASLLRSRVCYQLQELKLNNNGLGINGGKLLAESLLTCYNESLKAGQPLQLKVFIAGRNRLENDGATALAKVFKAIGTLEEIAMPQNGIYHKGITALSEAFTKNLNLQVLNLNDNTLTVKGATSLSESLKILQKLKTVNLGDCLLKSKGAVLICEALKDGHALLEELNLSCNEIGPKASKDIVAAVNNKINLKQLVLEGNYFRESGKTEIKTMLDAIGKSNILTINIEDDDDDEICEEEEEEDEDDDDEVSEEEEEDNDNDVDVESNKSTTQEETDPLEKSKRFIVSTKHVDFNHFLDNPTVDNYLNLDNGNVDNYLEGAKAAAGEDYVNSLVPVMIKLSSLSQCTNERVRTATHNLSLELYNEIFKWAQEKNELSAVNNALLVNLGLLKSEDKKFKVNWEVDGCLSVLKEAINKGIVPTSTKETIDCFLKRPVVHNMSDEIIIV